MDYKTAREELKPHLQEYVQSITGKSKGKNMYVCPLCGSGTGKNKTGAFSINEEGDSWKCFSCGESGDIFDLIGKMENKEEYTEQLKRAGELYGVETQEVKTPTKEVNNMAYYAECQNRIRDTYYPQKRGLSPEVIKKFRLGYDPHYTKSTGGKEWKALIIPTGVSSYVARNTDIGSSDNRYRKTGEATPLNANALQEATSPIYITEGELDALSIIEAGGEAIGLGSTANIDKFISNYVSKNRPKQPLILALDNDEKGQEATEKLKAKLDELKIINYTYNPAGEYKDANEALIKDRELFIEKVEKGKNIENEAVEQERLEYLKTFTLYRIKDFIKGIKDSVNTTAIPTGFTTLDDTLEGGLYEGLYILGAITSLGKTTLALQIADQIAKSGQDVLIFSLEMAESELISKSVSRQTFLDVLENNGNRKNAKTNRGITTGARYQKYSKKEKEIIQRALESYGRYAKHIKITEGIGNIGAEQIRESVKKHIHFTGKAPVVLIDYLQILAPADIRATDKQNTDKNILELKRISRDYKTPVIGISSLNRASYKEKIELEAFKESGAIEYGADVLIGLQLQGAGKKDFDANEAKSKDPREIELIILKNRNGKTGGKIELEYFPKFNYFRERKIESVMDKWIVM